VWLDLLDDARPVPLFGTSIVLKVARLTFEDSSSSAPSGPSPTRFSAPAPAPAPAPAARPELKTPAPAPVAAPVAAPRPAAPAASDNLLDIEFMDSSSSAASTPSFDPFSQQAPLGATSFSGLVSSGLTPMTLPASSARPAQSAGSPIWPGASPRGVPVMGFAAPPMAAQGRPAAGRPPAPGIRF
jgi:hypothetical protein